MHPLLGDHKKGRLFIISAPAGTGKTTLVQKLVREFSPSLIASISYTTRLPREGEKEGVHYHFISENEFEKKIGTTEFLEYVKLYGIYYGTSRHWVEEQQNQGKHVILVIDTQGALQLKGLLPAVFIFISPPSLDVLRARLINRQTETSETLAKRIDWAQKELQAASYYDYQLINDDLETAYQILRGIIIAECHRIRE